MALTLSYIGPIGIQKPTESKFWFSNSQRRCSQLTKTFPVTRGDYLIAWRGELNSGNTWGNVIINNTAVTLNQTSSSGVVGGVVRVLNVTNIILRGSGDASFFADPDIIFVRCG